MSKQILNKHEYSKETKLFCSFKAFVPDLLSIRKENHNIVLTNLVKRAQDSSRNATHSSIGKQKDWLMNFPLFHSALEVANQQSCTSTHKVTPSKKQWSHAGFLALFGRKSVWKAIGLVLLSCTFKKAKTFTEGHPHSLWEDFQNPPGPWDTLEGSGSTDRCYCKWTSK